MSYSPACGSCGNNVPPSLGVCPHCGRPSRYPNVNAANDPSERAALDARYHYAKAEAAKAVAQHVLDDFELAATKTSAVLAREVEDVLVLAKSDHQVYATFYQLLKAGIRLPSGAKWDTLRTLTDSVLFPQYKKEIRFAALSLDGVGLTEHYGNCSIVFRTDMIEHRASVFVENSAVFMEKKGIQMSQAHNIPNGYRATWADRGKLCVAKLFKSITIKTKPSEYATLLLREAARREDDVFVEVHIYGPVTSRTMQEVVIVLRKSRPNRSIIKMLRESFTKVGVKVIVK